MRLTSAHDHATSLMGNDPKAVDGLYDLSASVFEIIAKEAGGDTNKMQELLFKYQPFDIEKKIQSSPDEAAVGLAISFFKY